MFRKLRNDPENTPQSQAAYDGEIIEWEELRADEEPTPPDSHDSGSDTAVFPRVSTAAAQSVIDLDSDLIDISQFPALRMANLRSRDTEAPDEPPSADNSAADDSPENDLGISPLILKYAGSDDEPVPTPASTDDIESLPALFRGADSAVYERPYDPYRLDDLPEEGEDDFTFESEREKQLAISDELYDYISTIETDTISLMEERLHKRRVVESGKPYDPYNMTFNTKYDDSDDVLDTTAEIPLGSKYSIETFSSAGSFVSRPSPPSGPSLPPSPPESVPHNAPADFSDHPQAADPFSGQDDAFFDADDFGDFDDLGDLDDF